MLVDWAPLDSVYLGSLMWLRSHNCWHWSRVKAHLAPCAQWLFITHVWHFMLVHLILLFSEITCTYDMEVGSSRSQEVNTSSPHESKPWSWHSVTFAIFYWLSSQRWAQIQGGGGTIPITTWGCGMQIEEGKKLVTATLDMSHISSSGAHSCLRQELPSLLLKDSF